MADSKASFQSILNTRLFDAADPRTAAKVLRHMLTKYSRDQLEEFIRMPPDKDRDSVARIVMEMNAPTVPTPGPAAVRSEPTDPNAYRIEKALRQRICDVHPSMANGNPLADCMLDKMGHEKIDRVLLSRHPQFDSTWVASMIKNFKLSVPQSTRRLSTAASLPPPLPAAAGPYAPSQHRDVYEVDAETVAHLGKMAGGDHGSIPAVASGQHSYGQPQGQSGQQGYSQEEWEQWRRHTEDYDQQQFQDQQQDHGQQQWYGGNQGSSWPQSHLIQPQGRPAGAGAASYAAPPHQAADALLDMMGGDQGIGPQLSQSRMVNKSAPQRKQVDAMDTMKTLMWRFKRVEPTLARQLTEDRIYQHYPIEELEDMVRGPAVQDATTWVREMIQKLGLRGSASGAPSNSHGPQVMGAGGALAPRGNLVRSTRGLAEMSVGVNAAPNMSNAGAMNALQLSTVLQQRVQAWSPALAERLTALILDHMDSQQLQNMLNRPQDLDGPWLSAMVNHFGLDRDQATPIVSRPAPTAPGPIARTSGASVAANTGMSSKLYRRILVRPPMFPADYITYIESS